MPLNIDAPTLTAAGVGLSLLASLFRALFHAPKQRAQINSVEGKLDLVLNQVASVLPSQIETQTTTLSSRLPPKVGS